MSKKNSSSSEIVLAYPGEERWERWTGDTKKGGGVLRHEASVKGATAESPTDFRGVTHYAFPVTSIFCSPFWAAAEDETLIPDIVEMRLEANGTKPEYGAGQHYDYVSLDRDEERSLLMPILLADGKPIDLPKGDADEFDISPNFLALPRNHLVLWRELGRWVAVATRKGKPAYFQALNSDQINPEATLELKCLLLQLHSQGVIEELSGVVVWSRDLPEESRVLLESELEMSVHSEERPHPLLPEQSLELLPNEVAANREAAARRQKIRNWISTAALLYVLLLAGFAAFYFWKKREVDALQVSVTNLQNEVGWIEPTANRWNALEDAINIDRYPIDLFLRVLENMPDVGVRVLDIDVNTDRVLLKGEAVNRSMANKYISQLKANKGLQDYKWEHPPFKMDKAGIVTFELKGGGTCMGQLKASEVRLLIIFGLTVLILASFFLYEWYARALGDVKAENINLQAERQSLVTMKSQQNEYNEKRVWLNQHQPIARDEFEAKEMLDRVVSVRGIEAAGLTLVNAPPEEEPRLDAYYWAFERRVVVQGGIQNIVQWLTQLQSETAFRVITHLHISPKKKKEPESLTCEVKIEQRYATEEILAMTQTRVVPGSTAPPMGLGNTPSAAPTGVAPPLSKPAAGESSTPTKANGPDPVNETKRRIITPTVKPPSFKPSTPAEGGDEAAKPAVTRPRVRLPSTGGEQTKIDVGTGTGMLANTRRTRIERGPTPPPAMAGDIAAAEQRAMARGLPMPANISTRVERVQDAVGDADSRPVADISTRAPVSVPVNAGQPQDAPGLRQPYDSITPGRIVGEDWNENTPGAGGPEARVGFEDNDAPGTN